MKTLTITTITLLLISMIFCYAEDRYEAGLSSEYLKPADFNNDGYIDFCINNKDGKSINVFLNDKNGKFTLSGSYVTDFYPGEITTDDLDNDGWIDMVLTIYGTNAIDIYYNKGDGSFLEPIQYNLGNDGISDPALTTADINNDGWKDILVGSHNGNLLIVLKNNGNRTFSEPAKYGSILLDPSDSPKVVDIDHDGYLDVILCYFDFFVQTECYIGLFKNKGDGTFYDPVSYRIQSQASRLTLADIDNDGFIDILCSGPKTDNISILYNNKNGTYQEPVNMNTVGTYPSRITTSDINNDGWLDILVNNFNSKNISVFLCKGYRTFNPLNIYTAGTEPRIAVSDINNDGFNDILVSCHPSLQSRPPTDDIRLFFNNKDGTFTENGRYGKGRRYMDKADMVDIDNDGWIDIVQSDFGYNNLNGKMSVFKNLGNGKFDNSGIDLRSDPQYYAKFTSGINVKIIVDVRTFPRSMNVDLYFVMMGPDGTIYSGLAWNEGIFPALRNLTLPANTNLFDITLCEFTIPSQKPPVSALRTYTFAMGMFRPGTMESLSNIVITTLNVIGN
jgi:hypothetical protein